MKKEDVQKLDHGLYEIFWKESSGGGSSLASVGSVYSGKRWYAPTNWTSESEEKPMVASTNWKCVEKVRLIKSK